MLRMLKHLLTQFVKCKLRLLLRRQAFPPHVKRQAP
jgi:hypothetical protein